jgi:hypothetical protein
MPVASAVPVTLALVTPRLVMTAPLLTAPNSPVWAVVLLMKSPLIAWPWPFRAPENSLPLLLSVPRGCQPAKPPPLIGFIVAEELASMSRDRA